MKVLVISAAFPPMRAGEAEHAVYLCRHLADHGLDVHLLTTKTGHRISHFPFRVYPLIRNWGWLDLFGLIKFLRFSSPDAVLLIYSGWIYGDHAMITFIPTIFKLILPRVRFVTQMEIADPPRYTGPFFSRVIRKMAKETLKRLVNPEKTDNDFGTLLRDSDHIIVLSEHHLAKYSERFPPVKGKSDVIPPPPLLKVTLESRGKKQLGRATLGVGDDEFLFAYFGFVTRGKGIETMLNAFQILGQKKEKIRLVFIGGGKGYVTVSSDKLSQEKKKYELAMSELAHQLGIAGKVIWTNGYTTDSNEPSTYLWGADACILPFDDGVRLNNSTFGAAAAHKLPIITTRGSILESPFEDQKNVLLCPPKDPQAMAAAMEKLLNNNALQQRLKEGAHALAQKYFSWDKAITCTIKALSKPKED